MCSARLVELHPGGLVVAEVTIGDLTIDAGHCFWVIPPDSLFTPRGRPPTPTEMAEARVPYNAPLGPPVDALDSELDEKAAVAAAYAEQRRQPADLVNVAA